MKKLFLSFLVISTLATFISCAKPSYPNKGWHKGPYAVAMGGISQVSNDKNVDIDKPFAGFFSPSVGLMLGWDIADWIGPQFYTRYSFATDTVGNGTAVHPSEHGREHVLNISLLARFTLAGYAPLTDGTVKILPYVKIGGSAHGLYVNASTDANKVGSWGYGPAIGAGIEMLLVKHLWLGLDIQEDLLFLQSAYKTISGIRTKVLDGGFKGQFSVMGTLGWHY